MKLTGGTQTIQNSLDVVGSIHCISLTADEPLDLTSNISTTYTVGDTVPTSYNFSHYAQGLYWGINPTPTSYAARIDWDLVTNDLVIESPTFINPDTDLEEFTDIRMRVNDLDVLTITNDGVEISDSGGIVVVQGAQGSVLMSEVVIIDANNHYVSNEIEDIFDALGFTTEANTAHRLLITGNPHAVTKAEVGLGNIVNVDLTSAVALNTSHRGIISGNPHEVTKAEVGLSVVPNTDFTIPVANNTSHSGIISGNPHAVTKAEIGLDSVSNTDFTSSVANNTSHRGVVTGNPHAVTKEEVSLGTTDDVVFSDITANGQFNLGANASIVWNATTSTIDFIIN